MGVEGLVVDSSRNGAFVLKSVLIRLLLDVRWLMEVVSFSSRRFVCRSGHLLIVLCLLEEALAVAAHLHQLGWRSEAIAKLTAKLLQVRSHSINADGINHVQRSTTMGANPVPNTMAKSMAHAALTTPS